MPTTISSNTLSGAAQSINTQKLCEISDFWFTEDIAPENSLVAMQAGIEAGIRLGRKIKTGSAIFRYQRTEGDKHYHFYFVGQLGKILFKLNHTQ